MGRTEMMSQWAVLENADFRANDLVAFVRNVVLRFAAVRVIWYNYCVIPFAKEKSENSDMVQLLALYHYAKENLIKETSLLFSFA
jgi:hypothetical protein